MYHEVVNEEGQEFSRLLYKVVQDLNEFFYVDGNFNLDERSVCFSKHWDPEGSSKVDITCLVNARCMNTFKGEPVTSWRQVVSEEDEDRLSSMFYAWCSMRNFSSFRGIKVSIRGFEHFFDIKEGETELPLEHIRYRLKKKEGVADDNNQDHDSEGQQLGL